MRTRIFSWVAVVSSLVVAAHAEAQIFTPSYMSPVPMNELGLYVSDDDAVEGLLRGGAYGLRVGYVDEAGGLLSLGGELRSPMAFAGAPLALALTAGAQGLFGDVDLLGLQAGISAGQRFVASGAAFTPYVHPRLGLIDSGLSGGNDFDLEGLLDVGLDVEFNRYLIARVNIGLAGPSPDWGLGLSLRR